MAATFPSGKDTVGGEELGKTPVFALFLEKLPMAALVPRHRKAARLYILRRQRIVCHFCIY